MTPDISQQIFQVQQLLAWMIGVVAILDFLGLVAVGYIWYATRRTRYEIQANYKDTVQVLDRIGYYLFKKLGPADSG